MKFLNNKSKDKSNYFNYIAALLLVLFISSILILIQGSNPLIAFRQIILGSIGSKSAIASSIRWSTPVILSSMAAFIAQRSGINNLGIDGQIYVGAFFTAIVGAFLPLPDGVHVFVAIVIGGVTGALFALIPAILKIFFKVNEMIITLMFNYIAILLTEYFTMQLMGLDANTSPDMIATPEILSTSKLTVILPPYQASTGIFISIFVFIIIFLVYKYTKTGYEWKMIGKNSVFAQYGGIKVIKNYILIFITSAFVAGVCGSIEILGPNLRFRNNFQTSIGWDGIMVALVAKNNPLGAFITAIIWGCIKAGSLSMERTTSVNRILVTLVQALFVLFVTIDIKSVYLDIKSRISKNIKKGLGEHNV